MPLASLPAYRCARLASAFVVPALLSTAGLAQTNGTDGWASAQDPVANELIEKERQWAVSSCTPNDIAKTFLAPDFAGIDLAGRIYDKNGPVEKPTTPKSSAPEKKRDCELVSARVRFFGPDVAVIFGKERAALIGADGTAAARTVVWTDTAQRRDGRWQIIAVQDMAVPNE